VAETALLLYCVAPIAGLDDRLRERLDTIARLLVPLARHRDVRAAICLEPGLALDHAVGHILLGRLGYAGPEVDRLLAATPATAAGCGPERLPHRRLEQAWLAGLRQEGSLRPRAESRLVAESMLGRPLDVLGSTRLDVYAFTHAVMYASDLGRRRIALPRSRAAIAADALAALAFSLDGDDFDLTAELLLTWPMLRLRWSAAGAFAFSLLTAVEDDHGFLPGSTFDRERYQELPHGERRDYVAATCYHTVYVMAFLCAALLRPGCAPPATVARAGRRRGAGAILLRLADEGDARRPRWRDAVGMLAPVQQDALAPLLLAVLLRRARTRGDLGLIREALAVALAHDLVAAPAPLQAAALLRRSQALEP
jgi:hypothetical protein